METLCVASAAWAATGRGHFCGSHVPTSGPACLVLSKGWHAHTQKLLGFAVSDAAAGKAAEEEAVNEEEPVDRMTRLEKIKFFNRRSHLPRSAVPSVNACKHHAELGRNAFQRLRYKYEPVDACAS